MQLRMWMVDLAREQHPTLDHLRAMCDLSVASDYNALGLYLEHRYAYPSAPEFAGLGAVTPEMVATLEREYPQLMLVPFVNLLGHCEGFLYAHHGHEWREETFRGLQACPSHPAFQAFCRKILDDVLSTFRSPIIHLGGDETAQLGKCPRCRSVVEAAEENTDGKAKLYAEHFAPLIQRVVAAGRRPALWGDMFLEHPAALDIVPKETLIFDWHYRTSPLETSRRFVEAGFEVVCCPALHTYNAAWFHLEASETNVREHVAAAAELGAHGVCVTTWECGLFGSYPTLFPALRAAGDLLTGNDEASFLSAYERRSEAHGEWARSMGVELEAIGGIFSFSGIRSSLKARFLLFSNPFLLWLHHRGELCGEAGSKALILADRAIALAPDTTTRGIAEFVKLAVEFVRLAEKSAVAYGDGRPGEAAAALVPARQIFEQLERIAVANHLNNGGSLADPERCRNARDAVERAVRRLKQYGDGSLGYLPAFEILTHPKFVPHDQACWWLINAWANE